MTKDSHAEPNEAARRTERGGQSVQNTPNFANRTLFHGDNLEFLRGMNDECVDLIATDPPFNTGRNRSSSAGSYEDDWRWHQDGEPLPDQWRWENPVHSHWMEEIKDENESLFHAIEAVRRSHSDGMAAFICFLSVRLLEMYRILKPTGSIYVHCDDTANSYIRMAMDAIFGRGNRRNELVWRRYGSHNDAKRWGRIHDTILFYTKSEVYTWTGDATEPYSEDYLSTSYKEQDDKGRYTTAPLHARGLSGGGHDFEWRGVRDVWRFSKDRLDELDSQGMIHWPTRGRIPRRKVYLDQERGVPARDLILDIKPASRNEKTGSPDQKPLELYKRFILASTNEGDWVLDPFCGCATTPIAAEVLGRKWVGIDRRTDAEGHFLNRLLYTSDQSDSQHFIPFDKNTKTFDPDRLQEARNLVASMNFVFTDVPPQPTTPVKNFPVLKTVAGVRTLRKNRYSYDEMKDILIGLFGAKCWGCGYRPQVSPLHDTRDYLELDHIDPVQDGGSNELTNRALLCAPCNKFKSSNKTLGAVQAEAGFRTGNRRRGTTPPIELKLAREVVRDYVEKDANQARLATSA